MTARELAKEIFDLTEELRLSQPMIRWDKEDEAIAYWENKIRQVSETLNKPDVIKSVCPSCNKDDKALPIENTHYCKRCDNEWNGRTVL